MRKKKKNRLKPQSVSKNKTWLKLNKQKPMNVEGKFFHFRLITLNSSIIHKSKSLAKIYFYYILFINS